MSLVKVQAGLEGRMVRLTLDRPEKLNAFDPAMLREMADYIRNVSETKARIVVLDGEGKAFCAGGDLGGAPGNTSGYVGGLAKQFHAVLEALARLDAVVVTVVRGAAVGGGFALALAGDIRIGTPEAKFRIGYGRAGLTVDGGISWRLPRIIGAAQAQRLLVEDPDVDANRALALGLLHYVIAAADVPKKCEELLHSTEKQARMAISRNRALLMENASRGWTDALRAEADMVRLSAGSPDGMEGIKAFLEKRPPKFTS